MNRYLEVLLGQAEKADQPAEILKQPFAVHIHVLRRRLLDLLAHDLRQHHAEGHHVVHFRMAVHDPDPRAVAFRQDRGMGQDVVALAVVADRNHDGMKLGHRHLRTTPRSHLPR